MSLAVAILADDLTGTLDAAAPFAARGWSTTAALSPDDIPEALAAETEIVAVNTATRALPAGQAAAIVADAARRLAAASPRIAFRKIDSRLKGNIEAETEAALDGFSRSVGLACPAIPDIGRIVERGALRGFGVAEPIDVATRFGRIAARLSLPDAPDRAALDRIAADWIDGAETSLAIGARGLADALAAQLARGRFSIASPFPLPRPVLFGIGSRDPITGAQLAHLRARLGASSDRSAPNGRVPLDRLDPHAALHLVAASDGGVAEPAETVAARFAHGLAALVGGGAVGTLVLSGGDTALAVLRALGVRSVRVGGEAGAGIPWSTAIIAGREVVVLTKSGGFGDPLALIDLVDATHGTDSPSRSILNDDALTSLGMGGG